MWTPILLPTVGRLGWTLPPCSVLEHMKLANHTFWHQATPNKSFRILTQTRSHGQPSRLNHWRGQGGDQHRWSVPESQRHPPLHWKHIFRSERQREEVKGILHLSCSHVHPFLYSGSLSESTNGICKGFCIKNQKLKLEQKRINFEGTPYIH